MIIYTVCWRYPICYTLANFFCKFVDIHWTLLGLRELEFPCPPFSCLVVSFLNAENISDLKAGKI